MKSLDVHLFDRFVGRLTQVDASGRPEAWRFVYDETYASSDPPIPLSISMPVRLGEYSGSIVHNWFSNLLPEGSVRDWIATRLRLTPEDDFELLAAIGGECAGAVSITAPPSERIPEPATAADLETLLVNTDIVESEGWAVVAAPHRLSLAGAQDKVAVVLNESGRPRLPNTGEISTHILKPDSLRYKGLRDMEAFGLRLAYKAGLKVAHAQPISVAGRKALLIERYDRIVREGHREHLHQEDFCQALGLGNKDKYQKRGRASLSRCANLIRELALGPEALQGFLDWVIFVAILGNADAHAKNLSILTGSNGKRALAPFYDLVPTIFFGPNLIERVPALAIGDAKTVDRVGVKDFRSFAKQAGYAPSFVLKRVLTLATSVKEQLPQVVDELVDQGTDRTRLERVAEIVRANADRLIREIAP